MNNLMYILLMGIKQKTFAKTKSDIPAIVGYYKPL